MTNEEIKRNVGEYIDGLIPLDEFGLEDIRNAYIAGTHSRDDEIKDLFIAATGLAKENKELKIKLAELYNKKDK